MKKPCQMIVFVMSLLPLLSCFAFPNISAFTIQDTCLSKYTPQASFDEKCLVNQSSGQCFIRRLRHNATVDSTHFSEVKFGPQQFSEPTPPPTKKLFSHLKTETNFGRLQIQSYFQAITSIHIETMQSILKVLTLAGIISLCLYGPLHEALSFEDFMQSHNTQ